MSPPEVEAARAVKVATAAEITALDRRTIEDLGLPGAVLMETAGRAVAHALMSRWPEARHICLVCGPGNNGGDGFVAARTLLRADRRPRVLLLGRRERLRGDAALHCRLASSSGVAMEEVGDVATAGEILDLCDLAVDALFGTGLSRPLEGRAAALVEKMKGLAVPVVAVDLPSGICADTGQVLGCAVQADLTVTMGLPKVGLLLHPGAACAGEVRVAEIGFRRQDLESEEISGILLDPPLVAAMLPERSPRAHKGSCGRVLVLAGSRRYPGAAALVTEAVLRGGAGLVTAALPASIRELVAGAVREAITVPLECSRDELDPADTGVIEGLARGARACALGPGVGRSPQTRELVRHLVGTLTLPLVVDADAIHALVGAGRLGGRVVLTPHPGEASVLLGVSVEEIERDRVGMARRCAEVYGAVVLLKGAPTVVARPGGSFAVNTSGGPVLAQGGSGDVLTGVVAALLAQGCTAWEAACSGAFLHGLAGDICRDVRGPRGVLAGEVCRALPRAYDRVLGGGLPPAFVEI